MKSYLKIVVAGEVDAGKSSLIGIAPLFFIPVCAKQGDNFVKRSKRMPWYKDSPLYAAVNKISKRFREKETGEFYFPIQDTYFLNGEKVFAGTILAGKQKKEKS